MSYAVPCVPGDAVLVFVAPRVLGQRRVLPVRAVPVRRARRRGDQRLQAFRSGRVTADLELEQVERVADLVDFDLRGIGFRLFALADELAADDTHHDADQDQHDEDFDQGHAAFARARQFQFGHGLSCARCRAVVDPVWTRQVPASSVMPSTPSRIDNTIPPIRTANPRISAGSRMARNRLTATCTSRS